MTTDQTAVDRIPLARSVVYAVRGVPEVADEYNATRTIAPIEISLTYRAAEDSQLGRVHAYVKGWWMEDGKRVPMDKPVGRHFWGRDFAGWPEWLAAESRLHDPAAVSVPPPPPATRADVRDRIAAVAATFFANFSDEDAAKVNAGELAAALLGVLPPPADRAATLREPEQRADATTLVPRAVRPLDIEHDELMARAAAEHQARTAADQARKAAVLREAAQRLYTALFPAVYADMGQKAAEGVNRAVSELRRMADEEQPETEAPSDRAAYARGIRTAITELKRDALGVLPRLERMAAEAQQQPGNAAPEVAVDLTDGPVRCPLYPCTVNLHTPAGARAHFTAVHPDQRLTGRGPGPWPLLVTDGAEAQQPAAEAWVCKCPAGLCGCGHHAPTEQQPAAADTDEEV